MDLITKLKLTQELDNLANLVLGGTLPLMERIEKVRRIDEIIKDLTGGDIAGKTLSEIVQEKGRLGVRLKPHVDLEKQLHNFVAEHKGQTDLITPILLALNANLHDEKSQPFVRARLFTDLAEGLYIQKKDGGMAIDDYIKPKNAIWPFIEWAYIQDLFITGDKAVKHHNPNDLFSSVAIDDDTTTADEDFETEAQDNREDPPIDAAGAFYQSIIDGAEVDQALIAQALGYAEEDPEHYLLPAAAKVVQEKVILMAT